MKIDAVTVCIGFADYLLETLKPNRIFFNRYVVVTSPEDKETERVCFDMGVELVKTLAYKLGVGKTEGENVEDAKVFNKGAAINVGLRVLGKYHAAEPASAGWIAHLDADVVLPSCFRQRLAARLNAIPSAERRSTVYGIQRRMCESKAEYRKWRNCRKNTMFRLDARPDGVPPVGFFQLWHSSQKVLYPEHYNTAADSDLAFSNQFSERRHLPLECIHISAGPHVDGTDWSGRVSPRW